MPSTGEQQHRKGKEGLEEAKLWLESTTRFVVPFTSWGKASTLQYVEVPQWERNKESFDLFGQHLEENLETRGEFYAEVKRYSTAGTQMAQYCEFLTRCYSAMLAWEKIGTPKTPLFLWITWHPFGATDKYSQLTTETMVKEACDKLPERVKSEDYDTARATLLAEQLRLLIVPHKLEDMRMSKDFLGVIRDYATKEGLL